MFRLDIAINNLPWRELATVNIPELESEIPFDTSIVINQIMGIGATMVQLRIVKIH